MVELLDKIDLTTSTVYNLILLDLTLKYLYHVWNCTTPTQPNLNLYPTPTLTSTFWLGVSYCTTPTQLNPNPTPTPTQP